MAAAIEGAFFGIDSIAVSLEWDEHANYAQAAKLAWQVIEQLLAQKGPEPQLFNLNVPTAALSVNKGKRTDPKGRAYYWATNDPPPRPGGIETDTSALFAGHVTVTPLQFDLTKRPVLEQMTNWDLNYTT